MCIKSNFNIRYFRYKWEICICSIQRFVDMHRNTISLRTTTFIILLTCKLPDLYVNQSMLTISKTLLRYSHEIQFHTQWNVGNISGNKNTSIYFMIDTIQKHWSTVGQMPATSSDILMRLKPWNDLNLKLAWMESKGVSLLKRLFLSYNKHSVTLCSCADGSKKILRRYVKITDGLTDTQDIIYVTIYTH